MASADFWTFSHTSLYGLLRFLSLCMPSRPPQVRASNLHPVQPPHLHCKVRAVKPESAFFLSSLWTLFCLGNSSALLLPYMRFLFVGSGLCLRLPSDSTSRWTPLPLANTSYCQVCSGLSPPSYRPCRAHKSSLTTCSKWSGCFKLNQIMSSCRPILIIIIIIIYNHFH